jgi:hypothetical protein
MPKIFLPPLINEKSIIPLFYQHFADNLKDSKLLFLKERIETYTYRFEIVGTPEEADIVMLPQSFKIIGEKESAYIREHEAKARALGKPFVLAIFGDLNHDVSWPTGIVLRTSQYRFLLRPNEVMVPAFARDLAREGITIRQKGEKARVSFCGFAALSTLSLVSRYHLKNLYWNLRSLTDARYRAFKQGIYWRRRSMRVLARSSAVETDFTVHDFFSSHADTAKLSEEQLDKEFRASIIGADFVLTPKGDGNYSNRFYEVLSAGRIPILIDTECILPKEGELDYSRVILRVPMEDLSRLPAIVASAYARMSDEEFIERQERARALFTDHLRYDSFFNQWFVDLLKDEGNRASRPRSPGEAR